MQGVICFNALEDDVISCLAAITTFREEGHMKCTLRDATLARKKMELEASIIKAKLENALQSVNCITQEYCELQKQVTDLKEQLDVQNVSFS